MFFVKSLPPPAGGDDDDDTAKDRTPEQIFSEIAADVADRTPAIFGLSLKHI